MQEETRLIVLHLHLRYIPRIVVIREYKDVKVESGKEPIGSLVVLLEDEVREFPVRFVSEGVRLVYPFGDPEAAGVHSFGHVDILPALHPALAVHVEFDLIGQVQIERPGDVPDEVFEAHVRHETFLGVYSAVFFDDPFRRRRGGCEVTNERFRVVVGLEVFDGGR